MATLIALVPENKTRLLLKAWFHRTIQNLIAPSHKQDIHAYFDTIYGSGDLSAQLDGTSDWYLRPLALLKKSAPSLFSKSDALAVDLGTGMGTACRWLYKNEWQGRTIGIDFVESLKLHHAHINARHTFAYARLEEKDGLPIDDQADLIVAVNCFAFLEQPERFLRKLQDSVKPGGYLLIIDPHPSGYWRPKTRTFIRTRHVWRSLFESSGWKLDMNAVTALFRFGSIPILPLAQAYLCRKPQSQA